MACGVCVAFPMERKVVMVSVKKSVDLCGRPPKVLGWKVCCVCCISWDRRNEWIRFVRWSATIMLRYDCLRQCCCNGLSSQIRLAFFCCIGSCPVR